MYRVLTQEQIKEAKELKNQGYSRKNIADYFEIGMTTVWENIYSDRKRENQKRYKRFLIVKPRVLTFKDLPCVQKVILDLKQTGLNSLEVSRELDIPLKDVNFVFVREFIIRQRQRNYELQMRKV